MARPASDKAGREDASPSQPTSETKAEPRIDGADRRGAPAGAAAKTAAPQPVSPPRAVVSDSPASAPARADRIAPDRGAADRDRGAATEETGRRSRSGEGGRGDRDDLPAAGETERQRPGRSDGDRREPVQGRGEDVGEADEPGRSRRGEEPAPRPRHHPDDRHRDSSHHRPHPEPGRPRTAGPLYAALDLGTNNCRLLVAEPWHQGFRVVDAFSRIVRLGEGLSRSGRLSEAAQDRAIEALRVCRGKLEARGIVRSRLVATEACRAAENGVEFLDRVRREAGLSLEILTRETEARLAVTGCANLVDWTADGVLLFDIGGGSSELVWMEFGDGRRTGGDPTRHIRAWTSLPVGVVTLSERHGGVSVGPRVFEDMVADVDALLAALPDWEPLAERLVAGRYHMLGTSGTVTTLAGVHLGLKRYDRRRVDGTWLSDDEVGAMIDRLLEMEFEDRVANPCIGGDRADLVLAGCAILEAIRRRWRCGRLRVADRGLREGMLTELMIGDGVWRRPGRWPRRGMDEGRGR